MTTGPSNAEVIMVIIAGTKFPEATGMTTGDVAAAAAALWAAAAAAAPWAAAAVSEEEAAVAASRTDAAEEDTKDAVEEVDSIGTTMTAVEIVEVLTEEAEAVTTTAEVVTAEAVSIVSNEEVAAVEVDTTIKMIAAAIVAATVVTVDLIHSEGAVPIDRHPRATAEACLLRQPDLPVDLDWPSSRGRLHDQNL